MNKPVFYDPQRKRWKRLRRVTDSLALIGLLLGIIFIVGLLRMKPITSIALQSTAKRYRALSNPPSNEQNPKGKLNHSIHRKTDLKPSDVVLNTGEGLRAAFYSDTDAASYASFKQHVKQIDLLFPEWLHVVNADGTMISYTADNVAFNVVDDNGVHGVDHENKVARAIAAAKEDTEIFPMVNNYNALTGTFDPSVGSFLSNQSARQNFIDQLDSFLSANSLYRGLTLDFQSIPAASQPGYLALIEAIYQDFHKRNLRLYINVPVGDDEFDLKTMATNSDGLILMNYDQHQSQSEPGPVAGQDWFANNLRAALKVAPREKIIAGIGGYGYDWTTALPAPVAPLKKGAKTAAAQTIPPPVVLTSTSVSSQEAWQAASDSSSTVTLDDASLNPHFTYDDMDARVRHDVWFLDGVTALNQMRVARALGLQTFALWRLGSEDASIWKVWDTPLQTDPTKALLDVGPGQDIDTEGDGDIIRVTRAPQNGHRTLQMDDDTTIPSQYLSVVSAKP